MAAQNHGWRERATCFENKLSSYTTLSARLSPVILPEEMETWSKRSGTVALVHFGAGLLRDGAAAGAGRQALSSLNKGCR